MKPKARFINSVIDAAKTYDTNMPWTRGAHRAKVVARRQKSAPMVRVKVA